MPRRSRSASAKKYTTRATFGGVPSRLAWASAFFAGKALFDPQDLRRLFGRGDPRAVQAEHLPVVLVEQGQDHEGMGLPRRHHPVQDLEGGRRPTGIDGIGQVQGAREPASPRNGSRSAAVTVAPGPYAAARVSSRPARRPMSEPRCWPSGLGRAIKPTGPPWR